MTYFQCKEIAIYHLYRHAGCLMKLICSDLDVLKEMNQC